MITILYTQTFLRQFKKLPPSLQDEVEGKIALFACDPRAPSLRMHKLSGELKGYLSFSVNYSYRVVFMWDDKDKAALLMVGDHSVYD